VALAGVGAIRYVRVLDASELAEASGRQLVVGDRSIAVFRDRGRVFAMDGICPHAGSPLGPGLVAKGMVECPWHGWRFRFADGTSPDVEGLVQTTYPAREENGGIFVGIPDDGEDSASGAGAP
jgi:nitrite reductase/ring-hydroxylating ferredoxin subunit